jgi:glucosamine kinase
MSVYLGIDIGGTASRFALVDADGSERRHGRAEGANGHLFNPGSRRQFEAVTAFIADTLSGEEIAGVEAGITGIGSETAALAADILSSALPAPRNAITVRDDIEEAFRLLFAPGAGHLVSAGSGSIGVHVDAKDRLVRVGGRGMLIDDAGSGVWIALKAIDLVYREIDQFGAPRDSAILALHLFAAIGTKSWDGVRAYVYGSERGRIGELARAVGAASAEGCPVATTLLEKAGDELARLALALIERCGPAPVALIGRVPDLSPVIATRFSALLPGIKVTYPVLDLALGAARAAAQTGSARAIKKAL